ncbi:MAG: type II toxin-antitoxin system VapC family toxin [Acidobacteria bacterium]|nr:type II toxin-antitoxin system VapC family toxin [Acidobacteriota bacterium]
MLADTSVWVDHLRGGNAALVSHLERGEVRCHPFVIGELACGRLANRREVLALLESLPQVRRAEHDEVLAFVESNGLGGSGIGWIDAHLLASARLSHVPLWTLDRRLAAVARSLLRA